MIEVVVDDLSFWQGGAIARPVTATLDSTTPLLRKLEIAAGEALARQLRVQEPLAVGSAVVTGGGALAVELLIHAVISSDSERVTRSSVHRATTSALERAEAWGVERIALPPFGLGAGNLDIEASAEAMTEAIAAHVARARMPASIVLVVETPDEAAAFTWRIGRVPA